MLEETLPAWGLVLMRLWTADYLQFWAQRRQKVLSLCLLPLFIYHVPLRHPRSGVSPFPREVPHSRVIPTVLVHARFTINTFLAGRFILISSG